MAENNGESAAPNGRPEQPLPEPVVEYVTADFDGEELTEGMVRALATNPIYAIIGSGTLIDPEAWVRMCAKRIEEEGAEQVLVDILYLLKEYLTSDKPPFGIMRREAEG